MTGKHATGVRYHKSFSYNRPFTEVCCRDCQIEVGRIDEVDETIIPMGKEEAPCPMKQ